MSKSITPAKSNSDLAHTLSHASCLLSGIKEMIDLQSDSNSGITCQQYLLRETVENINSLVESVAMQLRG